MRLLRAIAVGRVMTVSLLVIVPLLAQQAPERMVESTVGIISYDLDKRDDDKAQTFSVGILIDETHAVTSFHSCCRPREGVRRMGFGAVVTKESAVPAQVIWSSLEKDIVILRLEHPVGKKPVALYPAGFLREGDRLFAVHYTGLEGSGFTTQVTPAIAGVTVNWQSAAAIHTDLAPYQNNDGAPLFTACGAVAAFRVNSSEPGGLAILASEILPAAEAAGIKISVASQACKANASGQGTPPPPRTTEPGKQAPEPPASLPAGNTIWIAILAGVVVLVLALAWQRRTASTPVRSRGPVLTTNLPPLPGAALRVSANLLPPQGGTPHAFLTGIRGEYRGLRLDLGARPIILGRDPKGANLVFVNETVSNLHCAVSYDPERSVFVLQDLGSANGTHLMESRPGPDAGQRLSPNVLCDAPSGAQFSVGDFNNRFQLTTEYPR